MNRLSVQIVEEMEGEEGEREGVEGEEGEREGVEGEE